MTQKGKPPKVEAGAYGYCVVTRGQLKGQVVYYDDDDTKKSAIIYPGAFGDGYHVIPRAWLRPATELEEKRHTKHGRAVSSRYVPLKEHLRPIVQKHVDALLEELQASGVHLHGIAGGIVYSDSVEQTLCHNFSTLMPDTTRDGQAIGPEAFVTDVAEMMLRWAARAK